MKILEEMLAANAAPANETPEAPRRPGVTSLQHPVA
jgi:hypothetical protein